MTTSDEKQRAIARVLAGERVSDVAESANIARTTLNTWVARARRDAGRNAAAQASAVEEMRQASPYALRDRPPVTRDYEHSDDLAAEWTQAEGYNAQHIANHKGKRRLTLDCSTERQPIALVLMSDQHIARGSYTDLRRLRQDAQLIAATDGCYAFLAGDGIDNHIKHRAAVINSTDGPDEQYKLYEYFLSIFAHRIAAIITGNHEYWTKQFAGVDAVSWLAKQNNLAYCRHEARVTVKVNDAAVRLNMRHTYRFNSQFNQTHSPKQWARMDSEAMADIYCIGDKHDFAMESCILHGKVRWFVRPGAYQISSGFSDQMGYNDALPASPVFIVHPGGEIEGHASLQRGLAVLRMYRGGK